MDTPQYENEQDNYDHYPPEKNRRPHVWSVRPQYPAVIPQTHLYGCPDLINSKRYQQEKQRYSGKRTIDLQ